MAQERVGARYATALYDSAKASSIVESVESDLVVLDHQLRENADFRVFLLSPSRTREEKLELLNNVFGDRVTGLTLQLIKLMVVKQREEFLLQIRHEYSELRRADQGIIKVSVTSADELTDSEKSQIVSKLGTKLSKTIEADFHVDPTLVGGLKVAYDDFIIDGTVRGGFARLRESLRQDTLKQA